MKGFTLIELLIFVAVIVFLGAVIHKQQWLEDEEQTEFMAYCQGKGGSSDECKWEWKRLKNGQKGGSVIFMPMYMGR